MASLEGDVRAAREIHSEGDEVGVIAGLTFGRQMPGSVALALALSLAAAAAGATPRDGATVYRAVCASCHDTGAASAPKRGDRKAWAPLLREGQATLTGIAYVGIRGMPAKGGAPDLGLEDFARAVVYAANESGARWSDPDAAMLGRMQVVVDRQRARLERRGAPKAGS